MLNGTCVTLRMTLAMVLLSLLPVLQASAEIMVSTGPTPALRGDATHATDITVQNGIFTVSFAVGTPPPWGVARGGIIDIALLENGTPGYDIASLADFMPNSWSSWPTTYQRVSVDKQTTDEIVIRSERDWGSVALDTRFTIKNNDSNIHIVTRMTNAGDTALEGLMSGYIVWPDGGSLFGVPGLPREFAYAEADALADWSAAYGSNWLLGLHAPFAEYFAYGGRDRYQQHDLLPGESRSFVAWLQIESGGSLAPLVQTQIDFEGLASGEITGTVLDDRGKPIPQSAVVVTQNDKEYMWAIADNGRYSFALPSGSFELYATAPRYTRSDTKKLTIESGSKKTIEFHDLAPPGTLHVTTVQASTGDGLDSRISVQEGRTQLIAFFGRNTFFTDIENKGKATQKLAPGRYLLEISSGGGFTSNPLVAEIEIESGKEHELKLDIEQVYSPAEQDWYSADLHHHSDVLDGFTEAEYVMRSQLASGVDLAFLSDHDSVENNAAMQTLAEARGIHFIAGTELSPSWAHFNVFPVDEGKTVDIDTGQASVQEIFTAARDMGADLIEVNHPYSRYGYFESLDKDEHVPENSVPVVPGGLDTGFDLVEIVPDDPEANQKTVERVWQLWNAGLKIYLAAGSDVHDVWLNESGSARTFAYVPEELTVERYIAALKSGHSYASQGPLMYPDVLFGTTLEHDGGAAIKLRYEVTAVAGLQSIKLIERGVEIERKDIADDATEASVEFVVNPDGDTWFSLVVEGTHSKFAYSNPVWVNTTAPSEADTSGVANSGMTTLAWILTLAMAVTLITALAVVSKWRNVYCKGVMPVSFFTFVAILYTSGLDVGLIMFPLIDFQVYASEAAYAFTNPLAIEFGFWGFLVWSFYFLTTFYFCIVEPKLRLFEIPAIKIANNIVTFGTCAFTAYLFLIYLPDYVSGISDPLRYGLVATVILCAAISSTDIKFVKILSVSSTWLFFALIAGIWLASGMGFTGLGDALREIGGYFANLQQFVSPITDYHQFYLYWWFAWSIMIGQFVAKFVSGLKAWQLLLALLIVPSIPIAIWFSVLYYHFTGGLEIGPNWRLAMVVVGVIFVINSLDSLIRLYTQNIGVTPERFGKSAYIFANWIALSALVVLYNFTPLKIEWVGLVVIGIYSAVYLLVFRRRRALIKPEMT